MHAIDLSINYSYCSYVLMRRTIFELLSGLANGRGTSCLISYFTAYQCTSLNAVAINFQSKWREFHQKHWISLEECDVPLVWRRTAGIEERLACHPLKYLPKMPDIAPKPILKRRREISDSCSDFMSPVNVDGCIH